MDIRWLQDFLALAETGNFTRAAELRNVSQSAFSRRIMSLEDWLGLALIDRSTTPARLTAEGTLFQDRAREIVRQVSEARDSLAADVSPAGRLRIAMAPSLITGWFPGWWSRWLSSGQPEFRCSTAPCDVYDSLTALVSQSVDIVVCYDSAHQPVYLSPDLYERASVGGQHFRPYARSDVAERIRRSFPGRPGEPVPLLMYSQGSYFGRLLGDIIELAPQRLYGRCVFVSDLADVLRNMAVAGHGVAWLPDCSASGAPQGALEPLYAKGFTQPLSIVAFRERRRRKAASDVFWSALARRADVDGRRLGPPQRAGGA